MTDKWEMLRAQLLQIRLPQDSLMSGGIEMGDPRFQICNGLRLRRTTWKQKSLTFVDGYLQLPFQNFLMIS